MEAEGHPTGTSLPVQWLRLCTSTAGGMSSIPGQGTKILHAAQRGQEKKKPGHPTKPSPTGYEL